MVDPIALAVPVFFASIGVEASVARARGARIYRFNDAVTDLSCGVSSQIEAMFFAVFQLGIYTYIHAHARVFDLHGPVAWVVAFFGVDFLYYWWHRLSHEVNILWAAHVIHHQSEDYNLAVALRQSVTTSWTSLPFYLPLAVLGVPTFVFAITHALSTLYQFWIHTQLVGKLRGPLDWVFNLPSHHRVHHAINPRYLDSNYAATLIVWDRLFGTYVEEDEPCVYGITKPLESFNPIWAQLHYYVALVRRSAKLRGFDRCRVWLASPAWTGRNETPYEQVAHDKYDPRTSRQTRRYVAVQYTLLLLGTSALLFLRASLSRETLVVCCVALAGGLVAAGAFLEQKRWATYVEVARLATSALAVFLVLRGR